MKMPLIANLDGEINYIDFDKPNDYNPNPNIILSNNIILLFQLSDTDTEFNVLYYVANKDRFDTLNSYGIDNILAFIHQHSNRYDEYNKTEKDNIERLIILRYRYITVLENIYKRLKPQYLDKMLML